MLCIYCRYIVHVEAQLYSYTTQDMSISYAIGYTCSTHNYTRLYMGWECHTARASLTAVSCASTASANLFSNFPSSAAETNNSAAIPAMASFGASTAKGEGPANESAL